VARARGVRHAALTAAAARSGRRVGLLITGCRTTKGPPAPLRPRVILTPAHTHVRLARNAPSLPFAQVHRTTLAADGDAMDEGAQATQSVGAAVVGARRAQQARLLAPRAMPAAAAAHAHTRSTAHSRPSSAPVSSRRLAARVRGADAALLDLQEENDEGHNTTPRSQRRRAASHVSLATARAQRLPARPCVSPVWHGRRVHAPPVQTQVLRSEPRAAVCRRHRSHSRVWPLLLARLKACRWPCGARGTLQFRFRPLPVSRRVPARERTQTKPLAAAVFLFAQV
jgi:hypothetical protein